MDIRGEVSLEGVASAAGAESMVVAVKVSGSGSWAAPCESHMPTVKADGGAVINGWMSPVPLCVVCLVFLRRAAARAPALPTIGILVHLQLLPTGNSDVAGSS